MDSQVQLPSSCPSLKFFVILFVDSPSSIKPHFIAVIISRLLVAGFFLYHLYFAFNRPMFEKFTKALLEMMEHKSSGTFPKGS